MNTPPTTEPSDLDVLKGTLGVLLFVLAACYMPALIVLIVEAVR